MKILTTCCADQEATDDQGRRRFHGAFTGGYSAGFFNTVGSLEGFTPAGFSSSRQDRKVAKYVVHLCRLSGQLEPYVHIFDIVIKIREGPDLPEVRSVSSS